jgi:hypothetical protein
MLGRFVYYLQRRRDPSLAPYDSTEPSLVDTIALYVLAFGFLSLLLGC